jgi:hypothetical protein
LPTGGRFATAGHSESPVSLTDATHVGLQEVLRGRNAEPRRVALVSGNYVPAVAVRGGPDPRSSAGRDRWWGAHFLTAEYGGRTRQGLVGEYQQMPDDFTPRRTTGQALSGHRRTHRMAYRDHAGGFTLRMPSATSIKAFERETGGTFDVPVSARDGAGRTVSGWVRVTHHRGGWASTPVGDFGPRTGAQVAESIAAVLEARRPSRALSEVDDLLARRRERQRAQGVPVSAVKSTFIAGVGYDKATGTMAVAMTGGRLYGYQVPPEVHRAVAESTSPGGAYNALVKGTGRAGIARCPMCGRFYPDRVRHLCPIRHAERPATTRNDRAREAAAALSRMSESPGPSDAEQTRRNPVPPRFPPPGRPAVVHPALARPRTPEPARPAVAAVVDTYPSSSMVNPTGGHQPPTTAETRWPNAAALTAIPKRQAGQQVPTHPDAGWTATERVAAAVTRYAGSDHVPEHYGARRANGDDGVVHFAGAGAAFARDTYAEYPPGALTTRQGNSPTLRHLLAAITRNPGRVELGGYAVGPRHGGERIVANRVYLFTDAPTGTDAWRQARDDYGILGAIAAPDDVRLVGVPWRPGEKAWLLGWE